MCKLQLITVSDLASVRPATPLLCTKGLPCITSSQIWSSSLESSSCETDLRDARIDERKKFAQRCPDERGRGYSSHYLPPNQSQPTAVPAGVASEWEDITKGGQSKLVLGTVNIQQNNFDQ